MVGRQKKLQSLGPKETIVFEDETGFILHPRLGIGWVKAGERLRIPTTSQHHQRLNIFGWVAPLLGRKGLVRSPQGNREGFIDGLVKSHRKPIFVIPVKTGIQVIQQVLDPRFRGGDSSSGFLRIHH